jgi:putative signal transducing protein
MNERDISTGPVTVLATNDPAMLMVAKSLLEDANIEFFAKGEGLQDLFGFGRVTAVNPVTGVAELQVAAEDAEEATRILEPLLAEGAPPA